MVDVNQNSTYDVWGQKLAPTMRADGPKRSCVLEPGSWGPASREPARTRSGRIPRNFWLDQLFRLARNGGGSRFGICAIQKRWFPFGLSLKITCPQKKTHPNLGGFEEARTSSPRCQRGLIFSVCSPPAPTKMGTFKMVDVLLVYSPDLR